MDTTSSTGTPIAACAPCAAVQPPGARRAACLQLSAFIFGATQVSSALADEDSEREFLAKVSAELTRLIQLVREAQQQAPTGRRVQFQHDWLLRDLALVQRGVDEHLDSPRQPRPVPPLRGDYRR